MKTPRSIGIIALVIVSGLILRGQTTVSPTNTPPVTWTTPRGTIYKGVKIIRVQADTVTILDDDGGATIDISTLPPDIQKQLKYDPAKAAIAKIQDTKEQALADQTLEVERQTIQKKQEMDAATDQQQQQEIEKENEMFKFPPPGYIGKPGEVMRIRATFFLQIKDATIVHFRSLTVQPYGIHYGEGIYDAPMAVYGLPTDYAEGSVWTGIVYPAGTKVFGITKYFVYATTKEQALEILRQK
jgi:hypothetical protein